MELKTRNDPHTYVHLISDKKKPNAGKNTAFSSFISLGLFKGNQKFEEEITHWSPGGEEAISQA